MTDIQTHINEILREVAELRAERDALRLQVAELQGRPTFDPARIAAAVVAALQTVVEEVEGDGDGDGDGRAVAEPTAEVPPPAETPPPAEGRPGPPPPPPNDSKAREQLVLRALANGPLRYSELAGITGLAGGQIQRTVSRLGQKVARDREGRYVLARPTTTDQDRPDEATTGEDARPSTSEAAEASPSAPPETQPATRSHDFLTDGKDGTPLAAHVPRQWKDITAALQTMEGEITSERLQDEWKLGKHQASRVITEASRQNVIWVADWLERGMVRYTNNHAESLDARLPKGQHAWQEMPAWTEAQDKSAPAELRARAQALVLKAFDSGEPLIGREVEAKLEELGAPIAYQRISTILRDLSGKFIRVTQRGMRHKEAETKEQRGRPSVEYEAMYVSPKAPSVAEPPEQDTAEAAPASSAEAAAAADEVVATAESLVDVAVQVSAVRDFVVKQPEGDAFTPTRVRDDLAEAGVNLDQVAVEYALEQLAEKGVINDESVPGFVLYSYTKPQSAGHAAEMDRERRAATGGNGGSRGSGGPVAGTGHGIRSGHKGVQEILDAAARGGAKVERAGSGHFSLIKNGKRVNIASTPGSARSLMNDKARVRRILGVNV